MAELRGFPTQSGPLDLAVHAGDVVHLVGGNGSGKTSLLRQLAGLDAPLRAPHVEVQGDDPRSLPAAELARRVRAVWSTPRAGLVGLTPRGEARLRHVPLPAGLEALADRDVATLSDGEARQVAIAFAAASPTPLLLLDEPAGALDEAGRARLDALVVEARRDGAVVVADHSGWAARHATRTVPLGPAQPGEPPLVPRADGPAVVRAPATSVRRSRPVGLPAVALGPGLHAVTGRNGAGKSTLLRRLAGLADAAGVEVAGSPPRPGHDALLLLPDAGDLALAETVDLELADVTDSWGLVPAALGPRHPLSLSAGEAQRVALAKALGKAAPVHLLDEPEAHLDADGRARLARAVADRVQAGACVVVATHDPGWIAAAQTRVEVGA